MQVCRLLYCGRLRTSQPVRLSDGCLPQYRLHVDVHKCRATVNPRTRGSRWSTSTTARTRWTSSFRKHAIKVTQKRLSSLEDGSDGWDTVSHTIPTVSGHAVQDRHGSLQQLEQQLPLQGLLFKVCLALLVVLPRFWRPQLQLLRIQLVLVVSTWCLVLGRFQQAMSQATSHC